MNRLLLSMGWVAAVAGALVCAVAVVARLGGHYVLGPFQLGTLLVAGIALMTAACVCLLLVLVRRADPRR
jgi:predicted Kef-type K+ transport protein